MQEQLECGCNEDFICYLHAKQMYEEAPDHPYMEGSHLNYPEEYRQYFEQFYAGYEIQPEYAVAPGPIEYGEYSTTHVYPPDSYNVNGQEYYSMQPPSERYYLPYQEVHDPQYYSSYTAEYIPNEEAPPGFESFADCRSSEMSSELIEDIEDSSDSDYAGSSAMSGSLVDFIDFDPEFNQNNMVKAKDSGDIRGMRPRKWLVDYAQQHCGSQLSSVNFPFAAKKRSRRDMEDE
jgi:hypothetical protein